LDTHFVIHSCCIYSWFGIIFIILLPRKILSNDYSWFWGSIFHRTNFSFRRVERALKIALEKQDDLSMLKASSVDRYTRKLEKDDVCMVCKLLLNKKDDILQCPRCESLFHNEHLLEWIKVRKKCPVCSHILYEKKGNR